jgi:hypothetical protein
MVVMMKDIFIKNIRMLDLAPEKIIVRCDTLEEAAKFLDYWVEQGYVGVDTARRILDRYNQYGSRTCYKFSEPSWCDDSYYLKYCKECVIVDFCDIAYESTVINYGIGFDELMQGLMQ